MSREHGDLTGNATLNESQAGVTNAT